MTESSAKRAGKRRWWKSLGSSRRIRHLSGEMRLTASLADADRNHHTLLGQTNWDPARR